MPLSTGGDRISTEPGPPPVANTPTVPQQPEIVLPPNANEPPPVAKEKV